MIRKSEERNSASCDHRQARTEDNFCPVCGVKLKQICNCWIKKSNYNCGESSCPGYGLFKLEKSKERNKT
jgi:hypothetical protein